MAGRDLDDHIVFTHLTSISVLEHARGRHLDVARVSDAQLKQSNKSLQFLAWPI
jgi:hypothetical protein